jgi:hypothetical protein
MTAADFLPSLQSLPRGEKLQLIQLLAEDLARDEATSQGEAIVLLPTDQCPYTSAELVRMRNGPGGRSLDEIRAARRIV